uniref:Uncharacterized protein n=1 Tax=Caenorhabditis japonica TaxID=281687 RepID=A0A8R1HKV9_CAEJA
MMRGSGGREFQKGSITTDDSDLPKKCVVIRKKKIGETVEKIELRYVAYNRLEKGAYSTTMEAINDATTYFKDRASDLEFRGETTAEKTLTSKSDGKGRKKLEQCLPILLNLCARFAETEKNKAYSVHKRTQSGALKSLCDEIVAEVSYVLNNGHPVTADLIKKIANINTLSRQVLANESKLEECLTPDENELAASKSKTSDKFK